VTTLAGRYRLLERLGAGGMSVVWRAYDEVLGRQVAVKLLAGEFATEPGFADRIRREAQAVARLSHPAITQVFDYGEAVQPDGSRTPFVVMELVDGESLAQLLARGPLPWAAALDIAAQVAEALATAHARGLVHRDVTPGNVMLTDGGAVKVVDFGISAIDGEREGTQLLGTPAYLSPERLAGAPARPATDVYCLGVLMCQLLTGQTPVDGRLPVPVPGLPPAIPALIARCLAAQPEQRPDATVVATALHEATGGRGGTAPVSPATARVAAAGPVRASARPRGAAAGPRGTRVMAGPPPVLPPLPPPVTRSPRRWTWAIAALAVLGVVIFACAALVSNHQDKGGTAQAASTHAPTPKASPKASVKCSAEYKVTKDWKVGFTASLTVKIEGDDVTGWEVAFDFPGNQSVDAGWPGKYTQTGQHVTIRNDNWNAVLESGKSYSTGILGHYTGKNKEPDSITLNGVECDGGHGHDDDNN
jgi:eukaryotic-like serine/threonine-protein kinase